MIGFSIGSIFNLMPTARSRCGDQYLFSCLPNGRQKHQLTHLHGYVEMLLFITEGSGHTTATGRDAFHLITGWKTQYLFCRTHQVKGFLITMAMQLYFL